MNEQLSAFLLDAINFTQLSHGCFHSGPYIKLERRYQSEVDLRADIGRELDTGPI